MRWQCSYGRFANIDCHAQEAFHGRSRKRLVKRGAIATSVARFQCTYIAMRKGAHDRVGPVLSLHPGTLKNFYRLERVYMLGFKLVQYRLLNRVPTGVDQALVSP